MTSRAIYDANVLYPQSLRDLLLRLTGAGVVEGRWTPDILDETFRNLMKNRRDLDPAKLDRTRKLMEDLPGMMDSPPALLVEALELPDPDDRHVLAAAFANRAEIIVTANLKDFPEETLARYGIVAMHPDDFLTYLWEQDADAVREVVTEMAAAMKNPPATYDDIRAKLEYIGLENFPRLL